MSNYIETKPELTNKEKEILAKESRLIERTKRLADEMKYLCIGVLEAPESFNVKLNQGNPYCVSVEVFKDKPSSRPSEFPLTSLSLCNKGEVIEFCFGTTNNEAPEKGSNLYYDKARSFIELIKKRLIENSEEILQKKTEEVELSEQLYQMCAETYLIHDKFKGEPKGVNMLCKDCNEHMHGDGYTSPIYCSNIPEDTLNQLDYAEPDSGPYYCGYVNEQLQG